MVFDPTNYAQNVMTAANTLQQINNQITSLQNEAQMLINQAQQSRQSPLLVAADLQQSIAQTQQLLHQAQRIAYDVQPDRSGLLDALWRRRTSRRAPHR